MYPATQAIRNDGLDIKSAAAMAGGSPDAIVYEQFGEIKLFDLKSGKTTKVNITLNADLASVRPRYEKVASRISNVQLSPTGARASAGWQSSRWRPTPRWGMLARDPRGPREDPVRR